MNISLFRRSAVAIALAATTVTGLALPVHAAPTPKPPTPAPPTHKHTSISADSTTDDYPLIGKAVHITGVVLPADVSLKVTLQQLVGKKWVAVIHQTASESKTGAFSFTLPKVKKAGSVTLRAVRAQHFLVDAGASTPFTLHYVKTKYVVTAMVATPGPFAVGDPYVVKGKVTPKATGHVFLDERSPTSDWTQVASAPLVGFGGTYTLSTSIPEGQYQFRVRKPASRTIGEGESKTLSASASSPEVTTTSLAAAHVGQPYTATLTADKGTAPYTWSISTLPAGVTLSANGVLSGVPTAVGGTPVTVTVTDANGFTGKAPLTLWVHGNAVYSWGQNSSGSLANGTTTASPLPALSQLPDNTATIAAGYAYGLALTTDGTVLAWGANESGQLGTGDTTPHQLPIQVPGMTGVVSIDAGDATSFAVKTDGTVWAWGARYVGGGITTGSLVPVQVPGIANAAAVAAGVDFALVLKRDGTVVAWGADYDGQLGNGAVTGNVPTTVSVQSIGSPASPARAIWAGARDGYALLANGAVVSWGDDTYGELGKGATSTTPSASPVPVALPAGSVVKSLACHRDLQCAGLLQDGTVLVWGTTSGLVVPGSPPTPASYPTPLAIAGFTGIGVIAKSDQAILGARSSFGEVFGWGSDLQDQLGLGAPISRVSLPAQVPYLNGVTGLAMGESFGFAIVSQ